MAAAGFALSEGKLGMAGIIIAGVLGNRVGSWIVYAIGYYGGRPFVEHWGRYVLLRPHHLETAERWFDTGSGFETAAVKQLASNIRTFPLRLSGARAPGVNYWDMAMYKQFNAGERLRVQLRGTMEGAMNHPQFGVPNTVPNNTLFGQITSVQAESRRVLVSLRLMF